MRRLDALHTTTARRRSVPLNREAMPCLSFESGKTGFRNACERAGISDFRIHDLRHTCTSWLVMAGVDLYMVRDLLGHASITQTERYAHLAPAKVAAAVALLNQPPASNPTYLPKCAVAYSFINIRTHDITCSFRASG